MNSTRRIVLTLVFSTDEGESAIELDRQLNVVRVGGSNISNVNIVSRLSFQKSPGRAFQINLQLRSDDLDIDTVFADQSIIARQTNGILNDPWCNCFHA